MTPPGTPAPAAALAPLTLALPKGRVLKEAVAVFAAAGLPEVEEVLADSRRLLFRFPERALVVLVVRDADVPTYVEQGAADCGVVGKDILLEQDRAVYEPLDLRIGACRLVVAAPATAADPGARPLPGCPPGAGASGPQTAGERGPDGAGGSAGCSASGGRPGGGLPPEVGAAEPPDRGGCWSGGGGTLTSGLTGVPVRGWSSPVRSPSALPRVATKFPRLTAQHYAARGEQVEVIRLSGAIELAPLVGLADRIVDLVQTGETLRQNGLVEVETILEATSRLIVNRASLKTKPARLNALIADLRRAVEAASGASAGLPAGDPGSTLPVGRVPGHPVRSR